MHLLVLLESGLWYEITADNRGGMIQGINADLESLMEWGRDNKTTFEADKTAMMLISNKKKPFDLTGIKMGGFPVEQVQQLKLVGYLFDQKMTFGPMVSKLAKKARSRVAALRRIRHLLSVENLKLMYTMFVRSTKEYGSVSFMGAAITHLEKLDRVQDSAVRCCGFEVESLQSRREAAAAALALKLLDGGAHVKLQPFAPKFVKNVSLTKKRTRHNSSFGLQLERRTKTSSLNTFKRSFPGCIHTIWRKIPQSLIEEGQQTYWLRIKKRVKKFLEGKWTMESEKLKPHKPKNSKGEESYSTRLNQELNAQDTDWVQVHQELKQSGISMNV